MSKTLSGSVDEHIHSKRTQRTEKKKVSGPEENEELRADPTG